MRDLAARWRRCGTPEGWRRTLHRVLLAGAGAGAGIGALVDAAAPAEEVVEITPDLITRAKAEGRLLMGSSSAVDEANAMVRAFEAASAIKMQLDRKVGVVAMQVFATEERAG